MAHTYFPTSSPLQPAPLAPALGVLPTCGRVALAPLPGSGSCSRPGPAQARQEAHTGSRCDGFAADWYGRVHLVPSSLDIGYILQPTDYELEVFNAHLNGAADIESVAMVNGEGMTLQLDTPRTLVPGESLTVLLSFSLQGSSAQSASVTLGISDGYSLALAISLMRLVPCYFAHNWKTSLRTRVQFETALTQAEDFREERRAIRTQPLRGMSASILVSGLAAQQLREMLSSVAGQTVAVPLYSEPVFLSYVDGAVCHPAHAIADHWHLTRCCNRVMLVHKDDGAGVVADVEHVDAVLQQITLTDAPELDGAARDYVLYPAMLAIVTATPQAYTDDLEAWRLEFTERAGTSQPDLLDVPALPETWSLEPDWSQAPKGRPRLARVVLGYPGSAQTPYALADKDPVSLEAQFSGDKAHEAALLDLFAAAQGRAGRMWVRDPRRAFTVASPAQAGATVLEVLDNGYALRREGLERIVIKQDGDEQTVAINAVTRAGGVLRLGLGEALTMDVSTGAWICMARPMRLDSDQLQLTHESDGWSQATLTFFELVQEFDQ